ASEAIACHQLFEIAHRLVVFRTADGILFEEIEGREGIVPFVKEKPSERETSGRDLSNALVDLTLKELNQVVIAPRTSIKARERFEGADVPSTQVDDPLEAVDGPADVFELFLSDRSKAQENFGLLGVALGDLGFSPQDIGQRFVLLHIDEETIECVERAPMLGLVLE